VLALTSSVVQPLAGRLLDRGRLGFRVAAPVALAACTAGVLLAAAASASYPLIVAGGVLIGAGVGLATPVAFATLAARTPDADLGRTMGAAEMGRELGDAGAPALVGLVAGGGGLPAGLAALGVAFAVSTAAALVPPRHPTAR
jgi:DHA1 family tetracycline resistance protein-like MFS transporter